MRQTLLSIHLTKHRKRRRGGRMTTGDDGTGRPSKQRRFGLNRCSTTTATIDHISTMPDEILVCILSLLTVKQAAVTSVLSSRWRNVWRFIVTLSFEFADISGKLRRKRRGAKFIEWVNSVLELHEGPIINKFKLGGCLGKRAASHIDSWISTSLAKNVETLELDLGSFYCTCPPPEQYIFPFALFSGERATCLKHLTLDHCTLSTLHPFDCFKSLVTLTIKNFDLTSDVINNILSQCPLLEHFQLAMTKTRTLVSLKVAHLRLKYLEVYRCHHVRDIDIHAPDLISLKYKGKYVDMSIKCGLQLTDVQYISPPCDSQVTQFSRQFRNYFSQIKTLAFLWRPNEVELSFLKTSPTLSNLMELVITLHSRKKSMLPCTLFLQMAPSLRRLELRFFGRTGNGWKEDLIMEGTQWEHVSKDVPHQFLKEVLLSGFRGFVTDMELSMYLLRNCIALEKFTIGSGDDQEPKEILWARQCAKLLLGKEPPHVFMSIF